MISDDALLELVEKIKNEDDDAWKKLSSFYVDSIVAYIGARLNRPRIVREIVISAFDKSRDDLSNIKEITHNNVYAFLKKQAATVALAWHKKNPTENLKADFPEDFCEEDKDKFDRINKINNALNNLSPNEKMLLEQYFVGGLRDEHLWKSIHKDKDSAEGVFVSAIESLQKALF